MSETNQAPVVESLISDTTQTETVAEVSNTVDSDDFISTLPEDLRPKIAAKGFKSHADLAKAYVNAESLVGKRVQDLTGDELKAVSQRFGAPADSSGYEYEIPVEFQGKLDEAGVKAMNDKFLEAGLSKDAASKVFGYYLEEQLKAAKIHEIELKRQEKEDIDSLKQEFGSAFNARVELAKKALSHFGGDELRKQLIDAGLSSSPALIKALSKVGELISEDTVVNRPSTSSSFGTTPEEAGREINRLFSDTAFMEKYQNPFAQGHEAAKKQMVNLYALKAGKL